MLVRGADVEWRKGLDRLLRGLKEYPRDIEGPTYGVVKGFADGEARRYALGRLEDAVDAVLEVEDNSFDIGAYRTVAETISEDTICFLNGYSQPLASGWFGKLAASHAAPGVGAVAATGSFESLKPAYPEFPSFPNPHLRSNAFMVDRRLFLEIASGFTFRTKRDAFGFESGRKSFTSQLRERGLATLLVGRDARGYDIDAWPSSGVFRLGAQANLLVADNQTRAYAAMPWEEKRDVASLTWGPLIDYERISLALSVKCPARPTRGPAARDV